VVERRFAFGSAEKEKFRTLMRMQEKFTGCRVVAYCLMCNHFHLLLEVPPMAPGGLGDEAFLKRSHAKRTVLFAALLLHAKRTVLFAAQKGQSFSQPYFLTLLSRLGNSSTWAEKHDG
jgi:REP element-mobilizing transposase RayT